VYRARPFRSNLLAAAVSAIDLALWDIKGKALGCRSGAARRRTETVSACTCWSARNADEISSSSTGGEEGFTAVKFDPLVHGYEDLAIGKLVSSACAMAAAAREAGGTRLT